MVVIAHHAIGMTYPVMPATYIFKNGEKGMPVIIIVIDVFLTITSRGYMKKRTCEFQPHSRMPRGICDLLPFGLDAELTAALRARALDGI